MNKALSLSLCLLALVSAAVSCKKDETYTPDPEFSLVSEKNIVIESEYMTEEGYEAPFNVILPADYKTSGKEYPVLYLLHGMAGNNNSWQESGEVEDLTINAVRNGIIKPYIIVCPRAYLSFYVDGLEYKIEGMPKLMYESFFFKELVPYIEKNFPVMTDREHTAVAGLSMGGYGASYYAFNYPGKFAYCASFSGAVEGGNWTGITDALPSLSDIFRKNGYGKEDFASLPQYTMDCGEDDIICGDFNTNIHDFLNSIGFPHTYRTSPGGHEWEFWKKAYERMIPELAEHFNK